MANLSASDIKVLIKSMAEDIVKELSVNLNKRFDELNAQVATLRADLATRDKRLADLQLENTSLKSEISVLQTKCDTLEGYSRRDNLVITGIPATAAEVVGANATSQADSSASLITKVVDIINQGMNLHLQPGDISTAHRLPRRNAAGAGQASPLPVVVRFIRRTDRDNVYRSKRNLKNSTLGFRLFVNEDLSPLTQKLFHHARQMFLSKRFQGTWTNNGKVFVKSNAGSITNVSTLDQLNAI